MQHHQRNPLAAVQAKIWGPGAYQDFVLTLAAEEQQWRAVGTEQQLASIAADSATRSILLRHRCRLKFLDDDLGDYLGRRRRHHGGNGGRKSTTTAALSSFNVCHRRVRIVGPDHAAIRRCCTLLAVRFPAFANRTPVAASATAAPAAAATAVRDVRAETGGRRWQGFPSQQLPPRRDDDAAETGRRKLKPGQDGCQQGVESRRTDAYSSFVAPCQPMPVPMQLDLEGFTWDKACRFYKPVPDTAATLAACSTGTRTRLCRGHNHYWGSSGDDNYSAFFTASHDSYLNDMTHNAEREDASSAKSSVTCARFTISVGGDRSLAERRKRDTEAPRCDRTVTECDSNRKNRMRRKATMDISIQTTGTTGPHHKWSCSNDPHAAAAAVMKPAESDKVTKSTSASGKSPCADAATLCSAHAKRESESCQNSFKVGKLKAEKCKRDADSPRCDRTDDSSKMSPRGVKSTVDISIQTVTGLLHHARSCSNDLHVPVAPPAAMKPAESDRVTKFTPTSGNTACADAATLCLRRDKLDMMLGEAAVHPPVANDANFASNRKSGSPGGSWFRGKLVHKRITWFLRTAPSRRTRPKLARF